jgi:DNA-binding CsgD family transcriptional regulator
LARTRALAGEEQSAAATLDEARRTQPVGRHYDIFHYLAEIELHRVAGRSTEAVNAAGDGALWARDHGMIVEEAQALDAWLRIAPSSLLAERLAELAKLTDSQLVGAMAGHARALVGEDPESLLDASERFADLTSWALAAEAALAAARIFDRRHQARDSKAAARAADQFAARCDGVRPRLADGLVGPTRLTKREREIATLAAAGHATKEMAARMYLSPRTVENHLYHAYIKLGVTDRAGLAAALTPLEPSE